MAIKDLSNRRRLPRAGTIRLGVKKKHEKSGVEYPVEVDHFVVPPLVEEQYGSKPKELIVMFPVESEDVFFPQFYNCYGKGILLCRGDGEEGTFWNFEKGDFDTRKCPCEKLEKGECRAVGRLQFLLPEIREAVGVYQIATSSKNSIIDINSGIDFVRGIVGRVAMIPLVLKREPIETHRIEGKNIKIGKHYTMKLSLGMSLAEIQRLGQIPPTRILLPPPDESQPEDLFPPNGHATDEIKAEIEEQEKASEQEEALQETKKAWTPTEDKEMFQLESDLQLTLERYAELGGIISRNQGKGLKTKSDFKKTIDFYRSRIKELEKGQSRLPGMEGK